MPKRLEPIHPGEIVREEYMTPAGLSAHALSLAERTLRPAIDRDVRPRAAGA